MIMELLTMVTEVKNMSNLKLKFHAPTHTYSINGVRLYSATQIFEPVLSIFTRQNLEGKLSKDKYEDLSKKLYIFKGNFTEYHRERGTEIHEYFNILLKNGTDAIEEVDTRLKGYLNALKNFLKDTDLKIYPHEKQEYHPQLFYACTPDAYGENFVLELKTGTGGGRTTTKYQLAYQAMILFPETFQDVKRLCVEVHEDGSYTLLEYTNKKDFLEAIEWIKLLNEDKEEEFKKACIPYEKDFAHKIEIKVIYDNSYLIQLVNEMEALEIEKKYISEILTKNESEIYDAKEKIIKKLEDYRLEEVETKDKNNHYYISYKGKPRKQTTYPGITEEIKKEIKEFEEKMKSPFKNIEYVQKKDLVIENKLTNSAH